MVFGLGNSADAFLILRAKELGLSTQAAILAYVVYQLAFAIFAMPAGILSDRLPRARVLQIGLVIFATVYLGFAAAGRLMWLWPLFCLYGLYAAMTDGVSKAAMTDLVGAGDRGTAIGVFHAATGIAALVASLLTGWLWSHFGAAPAFELSALLAVIAASALSFWKPSYNRGF